MVLFSQKHPSLKILWRRTARSAIWDNRIHQTAQQSTAQSSWCRNCNKHGNKGWEQLSNSFYTTFFLNGPCIIKRNWAEGLQQVVRAEQLLPSVAEAEWCGTPNNMQEKVITGRLVGWCHSRFQSTAWSSLNGPWIQNTSLVNQKICFVSISMMPILAQTSNN